MLKDNRYFLFGGCYSNLQATQKIKEIATNLGFKKIEIICTGDVVGYCAQPQETVDLIKNWGIKTIAGNVEIQLRDGALDCGCNFDEGSRCDLFSIAWFPYAQKQLSAASIDWMKTLPEFLHFDEQGKSIHVLHGGTTNTSEFIFASTPVARKLEIFAETKADIIIAGHCGLPFAQKMEDAKGNEKWWINPGVIGMPANDGTMRCWYGVLDLADSSFQLHSFEYDHTTASELMIANKLPKEYAHTLRTGIWDNCEILPEPETAAQGLRIVV